MMNRREAIRLLATAAAFPLAPGGMLGILREARAVVGAEASFRTLNAHQAATVTAMAEMILPRTETPGATDVGACEFIDLMLTEWYDEPERAHFLDGLTNVDARSQALFGKDFVSCAATEQGEMLIDLGEKMLADTPLVRSPRPARGDWASKSNENFYAALRRLTLTAYYTSEAGATQALHYEIIPDHFDPCAAAEPVKEATKPE
jgi:hypothetical protein